MLTNQDISASTWDVLVIGAGPAGCVSAITLASFGWRVLMVETSAKPRFKLGESVAPTATGLVKKFLGNNNNTGTFYQSSGNVSLWTGEQAETTDFFFTPSQHGLCLNRLDFEHQLRHQAIAAGVKFIDQTRFVDCHKLDGNDCQWQVQLNLKQQPVTSTAKMLLDCTGRRAALATVLGIDKIKLDNMFAYANWYSSKQDDNDTFTRIESGPYGWWYTNRLAGKHRSNSKRIVIFQTDSDRPAAKLSAKKEGFQKLLADSKLIAPLLAELGYTDTNEAIGGSAANSQSLQQYCGIGWMAVGDAAQAYDPLSSQGLWKALDTASNAAHLAHYQLKNSHLLNTANKFLQQYTDNQDRLWQTYKSQRNYFYRQQNRWTTDEFWQRRY